MMSKQPLISVIVPVYNVEKYLEECVQSILLQTYENIEVILVNDGSTDESKRICEQLLEIDSRIKYYEKTNSGLSDTRNMGLAHAKGEYVMFVDSDDLISPNAVSDLIELCLKYRTTVAIGQISHFSDGTSPKFKPKRTEKTFAREDALCDFLYQKEISTSACGKIYSATTLNNIRFKSGILFEDNLFLSDVFDNVECVAFCDGEYYGYRHRMNSITTNSFSQKDLDILTIGKELLQKYEQESKIYLAVQAYQCSNCLRVYMAAPTKSEFDEAIEYCKKYLDKNSSSVLKDKQIRKKLYAALILYEMNFPRELLAMVRGRVKRWK